MTRLRLFSALLAALAVFVISPAPHASAHPCRGEPDLADVYFSASGIDEYPLNVKADPLADLSLNTPLAPGSASTVEFTLRNAGDFDLDVFLHITGEHVPSELLAEPSILEFATSTLAKRPYFIKSPATGEELTLTAGELPAGAERTITITTRLTWADQLTREDMLEEARYRYRLGLLSHCSPSPEPSTTGPYHGSHPTDPTSSATPSGSTPVTSDGEPEPSAPGSQAPGIPFTGANMMGLLLVTAALVVTGLLLVLARRRREERTD